jgi:glucose/mannose-6-phosphate isomerase
VSDLSEERVRAADPHGMVDDVLAQPHQLTDALWRVESAGIGRHDAPGLCVCGMGGSAIGADLAVGVLGDRATRPISVARGYSLPPGLPVGTLILAASYSGDTEETLSCWDAAGTFPRVALTTGGSLAERARSAGAPVIGVPAGMQPRAAVVYMTVAALECAAACGAAPPQRAEIERAAPLLERLAAEWGPAASPESLPKALAARLWGTTPVVYGAGATDPVATRWKAQLNENAKLPAFRATLPEADHNEICGWDHAARLSAVFLDDPTLDPRLRTRVRFTAEAIMKTGAPVVRVEAIGDTPVERLLSLILLGDLMSVYAAVLAGRDPTPVEAIERFKASLAQP